jgi:hypothetical protein
MNYTSISKTQYAIEKINDNNINTQSITTDQSDDRTTIYDPSTYGYEFNNLKYVVFKDYITENSRFDIYYANIGWLSEIIVAPEDIQYLDSIEIIIAKLILNH